MACLHNDVHDCADITACTHVVMTMRSYIGVNLSTRQRQILGLMRSLSLQTSNQSAACSCAFGRSAVRCVMPSESGVLGRHQPQYRPQYHHQPRTFGNRCRGWCGQSKPQGRNWHSQVALRRALSPSNMRPKKTSTVGLGNGLSVVGLRYRSLFIKKNAPSGTHGDDGSATRNPPSTNCMS